MLLVAPGCSENDDQKLLMGKRCPLVSLPSGQGSIKACADRNHVLVDVAARQWVKTIGSKLVNVRVECIKPGLRKFGEWPLRLPAPNCRTHPRIPCSFGWF